MKKGKFFGILAAGLALMLGTSFFAGCAKDDGGIYGGIYEKSTANVKEYFYEEEIFHDQSTDFMLPLQPTKDDNVTLRLKVKRGLASEVKIKYSFDLDVGDTVTFYPAPMVFEKADDNLNYDYWIGIIPKNEAYYRYHFELTNKKETIWFDMDGLSDEEPTTVANDWYVLPDFTVPEWSQGAVWYSVVPDSYYNGNTVNDKTGAGFEEAWGNSIHGDVMGDYFGGDILGLLNKVDYMKGLNITSLFINPFQVTMTQAGYGNYDHFQIDSAYGNDTLFLEFVNSLHADELKIMCDAVIQYANINNIIYNYTGMYPDLYDGKYDDLILKDSDGNPIDSGWGGPIIDFSHKLTRDYFYSSEQSVLITYILKFAIDGWRMDVGNTLTGSDPNNWGNSTQILADIRKYIKAIGEDLLFLTEHTANDSQLTGGILDSKWNYAFESAVENWVKGISNAKMLSTSLKSSVLAYPRPVANAMYNHLTSHDYQRLYDKVGQNDVKFGAAQLIQFTYVGSPVVYYGEEIGLTRPLNDYSTRYHSFDVAMNWDESTWDYYLYNFTSALAELRKEYDSVYRFGAFADLYSEGKDNEHDVFAYARFDNTASCITLLNQNESVVRGFELDVNILSLKDGTVLTDYMSGREYVVKDGKVTVDIYPCGIVLVTGDAGKYRELYEICDYNGGGKVITEDIKKYTFFGTGTLSSSDDITFVSGRGFNNYAIEAELVSVNGEAAIMIRDQESANSAFYGVKISSGTMSLISRAVAGTQYTLGASYDLTGVKKVMVGRTQDNALRTYVDDGNGGWKEVETFALNLEFDYDIYLGVAPLSGNVTLKLELDALSEQTGSDYSGGLGSQAITLGEASALSISNDKLTIGGSENDSFVVTRAHYKDFTHKALVSYNPQTMGSFAGLTVMQSENDYIVAGRYFDGNAVSLIVGQVINGKLCIYAQTQNIDGDITLQIQKSGTTYTALVSTDGTTFTKIGSVTVNYSDIYAGIVRSGDDAITIDYWCFGDAVSSANMAAHYAVGEMDFNFVSSDTSLTYTIKNGEWEYVQGGIAQTDKTASNALYNLQSKKVSDFRATFTLNVTDIAETANSYVGTIFGRATINGTSGYILKIFADGSVKLENSEGTTIADGQTSLKAHEQLQFTLITKGNVLALYEDNDPQLVLYCNMLTNTEGYFGWICNKATFELYSYNVYVPSGNVLTTVGSAYILESTISSEYVDLELSSSNSYNYITMKDIGASDFAVSYNLQISRINTVYRGYADFAFGVSVGAHHLSSGIVVRINDMGKMSIYVDGNQIEKDIVTGITNTRSCFIVITYQNRTLKVYYANYEQGKTYTANDLVLAYTYNDSMLHSGSLAFYSQNAGARYNAIRGYGLSDGTDVTTLDLYNDIVIDEPMPGDPEIGTGYGGDYRNDFNGNSDLATILKYSGANTVKDGYLTINGFNPQNWDAGAAIATGIYKNFELTARFKVAEMTTNGGFVGIEFYKSSATNNHQASTLTIIVYPTGSCALFVGNGILSSYATKGDVDSDGFFTVHLKVQNGVIIFDLGGESVSANIADLENNSDLTEGYISLNAGANTAIFDYVDIKVLD